MTFKSFIFNFLFLALPVIGFAQKPGGPGPLKQESRERIDAQRVAFITAKLSLSPDEAAKFWPVYNEHKESLKKLRDDIERPDLIDVTDSEANAIIERHLQMEEKKLELNRNLYMRLRTAISPKKILLLHAAEREFNRELLKRANDFRREK